MVLFGWFNYRDRERERETNNSHKIEFFVKYFAEITKMNRKKHISVNLATKKKPRTVSNFKPFIYKFSKKMLTRFFSVFSFSSIQLAWCIISKSYTNNADCWFLIFFPNRFDIWCECDWRWPIKERSMHVIIQFGSAILYWIKCCIIAACDRRARSFVRSRSKMSCRFLNELRIIQSKENQAMNASNMCCLSACLTGWLAGGSSFKKIRQFHISRCLDYGVSQSIVIQSGGMNVPKHRDYQIQRFGNVYACWNIGSEDLALCASTRKQPMPVHTKRETGRQRGSLESVQSNQKKRRQKKSREEIHALHIISWTMYVIKLCGR